LKADGSVDSNTYVTFPAGTTLLFYQAAAPTGWTKVTTQNNKALRVVSGATGGTASVGGSPFTSVFASRTPSGTVTGGSVSISISGNTGSTALTAAQLPLHQHGLGNHTHTINDPGHTHRLQNDNNNQNGFGNNRNASGDGTNPQGFYSGAIESSTTGISLGAANGPTGDGTDYGLQGQGHTHTFSGSGSGSVTGASFAGSAMDFTVQYIDVILCSKN
jgi:hypothetical protein